MVEGWAKDQGLKGGGGVCPLTESGFKWRGLPLWRSAGRRHGVGAGLLRPPVTEVLLLLRIKPVHEGVGWAREVVVVRPEGLADVPSSHSVCVREPLLKRVFQLCGAALQHGTLPRAQHLDKELCAVPGEGVSGEGVRGGEVEGLRGER